MAVGHGSVVVVRGMTITDRVAIEVRALRVLRGGNAVVREVDLDIPAGKVTGLLGPSGCGKTTLMRAIAGLQIVAAGSVTVLGAPSGSRELRSRVGYMPQTTAVYQDLTVVENLAYFARLLGVGRNTVRGMLQTVGLDQFADRQVGRLSGGERARVSLAATLLNEPDVLILDEPTVGLDPILRRDLWQSFHRIAESGSTLLVSSHVMDEAERCDELILMREGRIVANESPARLLERTGAKDIETAFLNVAEGEEAR